MSEALGGVVQGYVVVAASKDGIEKKRVDVGLKVAAVHLDAELVAQNQCDSEGVVFVIIGPVILSGKDNLLQRYKILVGDGQGDVRDHLDTLGNNLFSAGAPDPFPIIAAIGGHHFIDGGQGFSLAKEAGIGYQLPGATEVEAETAEVVVHPLIFELLSGVLPLSISVLESLVTTRRSTGRRPVAF